MRSFPAAAALALLLVAPANAGTSCNVLPDPAGDATVSGIAPSPDPHVDVRGVNVGPIRSGLIFRIMVTDLVDARHAEWQVTFDVRGTRLFVGGGDGSWVNIGSYEALSGFRAGVAGRRLTEVRGMVDYARDEVRIDVPYAAFGSAAPRHRDALTKFAFEAREVVVNLNHPPVPANQLRAHDTGTSTVRYVVGPGC